LSLSDVGQPISDVRFTPKADMLNAERDVRFVPEADIPRHVFTVVRRKASRTPHARWRGSTARPPQPPKRQRQGWTVHCKRIYACFSPDLLPEADE
jgi:hypothetical protein